jgi:hypothetical protein
LTRTANGKDLYIPANPASGGDVINGNLAVTGNMSVGGTTTLTGAVTAVNTLYVNQGLIAGAVNTPGAVTAGSFEGASSSSSVHPFGATLGANTILANASTSGTGASPGLAGSRVYQVTLAGATGAQDIGLNVLANQASGHTFVVQVTEVAGPAVCYGLFMTFPPAASTPPEVINAGQGFNGLTWNIGGTPGAYIINLNTGPAGLYNVVVTIIA